MLSFGFPLKNMELFWTYGVFEMKIEHKPPASWVGNPFVTSWGDNPLNLLKSTRSEGWRSLTAKCCLTSLGEEILSHTRHSAHFNEFFIIILHFKLLLTVLLKDAGLSGSSGSLPGAKLHCRALRVYSRPSGNCEESCTFRLAKVLCLPERRAGRTRTGTPTASHAAVSWILI